MNDTAQTENALVRNESTVPAAAAATGVAKKEEKPAPIYDADARNRFDFTVREGVKQYDTAHIYEPLGDERYLQWLKEFKVKGNEDDVDEESREASVRLWDEQIFDVANIEYPDDADWRSLIPASEKIEGINSFLAVAIAEDIEKVEGKRQLGSADHTITVRTETFFNGDIAMQTHELRPTSLELEKKYSRIQGKRFKQEKIGGLRKKKAKIEFLPQDKRIGELYDEMFVSSTGFANGKIPLRFKTTVIHHLFAETLDQKKSQE
jgi:hypothetical protein